jgi:hypothetical protein
MFAQHVVDLIPCQFDSASEGHNPSSGHRTCCCLSKFDDLFLKSWGKLDDFSGCIVEMESMVFVLGTASSTQERPYVCGRVQHPLSTISNKFYNGVSLKVNDTTSFFWAL